MAAAARKPLAKSAGARSQPSFRSFETSCSRGRDRERTRTVSAQGKYLSAQFNGWAPMSMKRQGRMP